MSSLPQTQVRNSTTFTAPPLHDRSLTLPDLYDWHSVHSPTHPLFVFDEGHGHLRHITYSEAVRAIHTAARLVSSFASNAEPGTRPVIAILATSDFVTYFCLILGVLRAGFIVFPISPRNSPSAVAHLLEKTAVTHVYTIPEPSIQATIFTALASFQSSHICVSTMPVFEDLFRNDPSEPFELFHKGQLLGVDDPAMILHSSGTTTFPKPIVWTNGTLLETGTVPWYGEVDLCGVVMCTAGIPMFHGMGITQMIIDATCGLTMSVFKPSHPATVPNPTNVFETVVATKAGLVGCAPSFIEAWAKVPEYVAVMKKMKGVIYGGGPLNKAAGDYLASQGVNIHVTYASTEGGVMSAYVRNNPGMDWEYFKFSGHTRPEFISYGDRQVEVIMKAHEGHNPRAINAKIMGQDSYGTNDLLEPHPTDPSLWKMYGRADDQIMLSTGEKTNPGPLEAILCQDHRIKSAVMFGRGQFQNGVIVDPTADYVFDPSDIKQLNKFRTLIWPTVIELNQFAPTHSRIFREMILVTKPSKPFIYSMKGTVRRVNALEDYADEIGELYTTVKDIAQKNVAIPKEWTYEETLQFVRVIVASMVTMRVEDTQNIFQHGCDSLQATWIRNTILRALRDTHEEYAANRLPEDIIYSHPTIVGITTVVASTVADSATPDAADLNLAAKAASTMVEKYSKGFPTFLSSSAAPIMRVSIGLPETAPGCVPNLFSRFRPGKKTPAPPFPNVIVLPSGKSSSAGHSKLSSCSSSPTSSITSGDIVLVTGTTGGFGSNLLYHLALSPDVAKVYALNRRASPEPFMQRQRRALRWVDDIDLFAMNNIKFVECDLGSDMLGLDADLYEEISTSVTHIIHNAWRVDFNLSLESFELNIRELRNLIDMALSSPRSEPPRLIFTSSIAVFRASPAKGAMPEEEVTNPLFAAGSGYSESKWVAERVLMAASRATPLRPIIIRLGQLTGNRDGYWNQREWFPAVVKSASTLGCLPDSKGTISWIPPFEASKVLLEMRNVTRPILHIVHPRPVSWASIMKPIAQSLNVPLVPYSEWFKALEDNLQDISKSAVENMKRNPALRLLAFFRMSYVPNDDREPLGIPRLSVRQATRFSKTLQSDLRRLQPEDAQRWLEAWRSCGFLSH